MSDAEAVLAQALRVIDAHQSGCEEDELVREVERYCSLFTAWESRWKVDGSEAQPAGQSLEDELLHRIAEGNKRVMEILACYTQEASAALTGALKRSKAVRAYIDIFPQRISIGKPRKG